MSLSTKEVVILGLLPMGQLYARVMKLNGSLDKKWALLPFFMMPPLQFIPLLMMKWGMIKKGKGGKPYDWFMLIPLILKITLAYLLEYLDIDFPLSLLVNVLANFLAVLIPYLIRTKKLCKKVTGKNLLNSMAQAAANQSTANIFSAVIGFVPIVGMIFDVLSLIPIFGDHIPWMLSYTAGYVITNMYNGDDPNKFCLKGSTKVNLGVVVTSLAISTVIKFFID